MSTSTTSGRNALAWADGFGDARRGARHDHALPGEQEARRFDERTVVVD
jgi:hypothetical protein